MLCAQVWAGGRKAQIALVDTGIGIRTSLGLNATYTQRLSSENACEMATEYGVTGKPGKGHAGRNWGAGQLGTGELAPWATARTSLSPTFACPR